MANPVVSLRTARRRPVWSVIVLVLAACLTLESCTDTHPSDPGQGGWGGSGAAAALTALRDPWGLYVDPTYFDQEGSVYSTAVLHEVVDSAAGGGLDLKGVAEKACGSEEKKSLGEPWFSWSMARVFGTVALDCVEMAPPSLVGDVASDVSRLYAWADMRLMMGQTKEAVRAAIPQLPKVEGSNFGPYTMWRMDQLEDLLGLNSTADSRGARAPTNIASADDLSELWGYTMRCASRPSLCSSSGLPSNEEVAAAGVNFLDDLSLAGAVQILRTRGDDSDVAAIQATIAPRRVAATGLIRQARFIGTVDTTFTVLQLAPDNFPGPDPARTSAQLVHRLESIPKSDTVKRLRALAVLRAVDETAWKKWSSEIEAVRSDNTGRIVTKATLKQFTDIATALGNMLIEAPQSHLKVFAVNNEEDEYWARMACAYSWAFDNGDEILKAYASVQQSALRQAHSPSEPVKMYVAGLRSLSGVGLSAAESQEIVTAVQGALRGCEFNGARADQLYRFEISKSSACSLDITLGVVVSGFGG